MFVLVAIQIGTLIYCLVSYSQIAAVARSLWFDKLTEKKRSDFEKSNRCFGYSDKIDVAITRYRITCQELFEAILSRRYMIVSVVLFLVVLFNVVNLSIGFYLAKIFPPNEARQRELEFLRKSYHANQSQQQAIAVVEGSSAA